MAKRKLEMDVQLGNGTRDYNKLKNLPQINGVELKGNVDSKDLHIKYSDLTNIPSDIVQDANYVHTDNNFTNSLKNKLQNLNVGTGNLLIKRNNELLATFNANSTSNVELNIEVPTKSTDLSDSSDLARQSDISGLSNRIGTAENEIIDIETKIPSNASSSDKLTTESFVNQKVEMMLAYYITKNAQGDAFATKAELTNATTFYSGGQVRVPRRNDYCNVLADESQPADSLGHYPTTRYLYNNGWEFQFVISTISLTNEQLAALNSGITSTLVGQISTNQNNITNLQSSKQDNLSTAQLNAVNSGVTSSTVTQVATNTSDISGLQSSKQNTIDSSHKLDADLVDDSNSTNKFVTAEDKTAWNAKQNEIDSSHKLSADLVDDTSSTNKFVTQTEKNTWDGKQDQLIAGTNITIQDNVISASGSVAPITVDSQLSTTSENPVQNKVITNELYNKQAALSQSQMDAVNSGITSAKLSNLETDAHTHSNKSVLDGITQADITSWDNKLDSADLPVIINLLNNGGVL